MKIAKLLSSKIVNELIHFFKLLSIFKDNFSKTIWYIGLKFSQTTEIVMPFFLFGEFFLIA